MSSDNINEFSSYSINKLNTSYSSSFLPLNDTWILSIFILCLLGLLCTIILSLILIYLSSRRSNDHVFLTNLFICFSLAFIYLILIIFLLRSNEILCSLREFLSQLSYAFLYSAFLSRYIMQWLGSRILSKRTKHYTSLLIYMLLIFIQIPIGILWWYFTSPRLCQHIDINRFSSQMPNFFFQFHKPFRSTTSCSNRCTVDYRFYATFTYTIVQLVLCTILSTCLFFCRHCRTDDKLISTNGYHRLVNCLHMFAFIFIDFIWLIWTLIYYFTSPFFIYPALILSMFSIATISLLFILLPQIYYYSKIKINDIEQYQLTNKVQSTTLYSNKLAANEHELLFDEKKPMHKAESEISYELGDSGTFLPITRTPKGPFKVFNHEKKPSEKLDDLIYDDDHHKTVNNNEIKVNTSVNDVRNLQPPVTSPLQRQLTSSSVASDFVSPSAYRTLHSDTPYYSTYQPPRRDETIIPILCTSERPRTSTPVKMRILVNNTPSSSVPTTRRLYSSNDLRHIRQSYSRIQPPPSSQSAVYCSPQTQQYLYFDPYRTTPTHIGGNTWQSVLLQPPRSTPSSSYRRFPYDNRSLSQRLWDIDSGDDDDNEIEEDIIRIVGRHTPPTSPSNVHFRHPEENTLLHIDDDEEENSNPIYRKQYAHV